MTVSVIHPARASHARDLVALETALSGLALDSRSPVALELAATATSRQFLLRAETEVALQHLQRQLQARYPQAVIREANADPLQCRISEECSVVELHPGATSDLPLRTWKSRDLLEEGTDPILGILAAFGSLPIGTRALVQLALVPATPQWSRVYRRRAVEHPLEQERMRQYQQSQIEAPSMGRIVVLFLLVLSLVIAFTFRTTLAHLVPSWFLIAATAIVHGRSPNLDAGHLAWLVAFVVIDLAVLFSVLYAVARLMSHFGQGKIYDQRLVEEKTARPAYRVRLRLLVFSPGEVRVSRPTFRQRMQSVGKHGKAWAIAVFVAFPKAVWRHAPTACRSLSKQIKAMWKQEAARWRRFANHWQAGIQQGRSADLKVVWDLAAALVQSVVNKWQSYVSETRTLLSAIWRRGAAQWRRCCQFVGRMRQSTIARWRAWLAGIRREHAWRKRAKERRKEREDLLRMLTASYRQYHLASGGYFVPKRLSPRRIRKLFRPTFQRWVFRRSAGWVAGVSRSAHLLSVADLAALWHLPQAQDLPDLAYMEQTSMRTLLAPARLSKGHGYRLGTSTHAGQRLPVYLPSSCLRQNLLAAASTGKGKSTLFEHLMCALAQARGTGQTAGLGGAMLVDPHGDLASRVSSILPEALVDDIVLIELSDREYPVAFNPLDMCSGADRDKIVDNLIAVIEALWPTSYGPRTESFVEYSAKTLAEANLTLIARDPILGPDEQFTLLDVVPLFRQESFRHAVLELVQDQHILNWWKNYYEQLDGRQQADFTSSVVTKFSKFASTRICRRILGQPRSSLNFAELIRQEKILLLSCAAGEVGADLAALFGSLFVGFFQAALQEQASLPFEQRHRFLVLIDEFQSLVGINYQTMLAELRKYGGSFGLATQSMAYLDRFEKTLRATVLANVDHVFAFTMADEDARLLRLPGVEPEDVTALPDYTCYVRLSLGGERLPVFSLRLAKPAEASTARHTDIVNRTRCHYGRPVGTVEGILLQAEARHSLMRPTSHRQGGRGHEVLWQGKGEERVEEVLKRAKKRGRGGKTPEESNQAEHTMFEEEGPDEH